MTDGKATADIEIANATASLPRRRLLGLRPPVFAVVLLVLASVVAALIWTFVEPRDRVRTIAEGKVYQSGVIPPEEIGEVVRRLGIRTVIDLREPVEEVQSERAALTAVGVKHVHLPSTQVPTEGTVSRYLDLMREPATYPVLIHCYHGTGRSVLMSALYRIEFEGWDHEKARRATRPALRWLFPGASFDVDAPKGEFLMKYVPRQAAARGTK